MADKLLNISGIDMNGPENTALLASHIGQMVFGNFYASEIKGALEAENITMGDGSDPYYNVVGHIEQQFPLIKGEAQIGSIRLSEPREMDP